MCGRSLSRGARTHLPVGDGELDAEADGERQRRADQSRLEPRQNQRVDERVRPVPEHDHERREEEIVQRRVHHRELGARLHLRRSLRYTDRQPALD